MPTLDTKAREHIRKADYAYVDRSGAGHLPINDEAHVRNAMARWNQTEFESQRAKEQARKKILTAARTLEIEVSEDDKVMKPSASLRAAQTKAGPRGGRKTSS